METVGGAGLEALIGGDSGRGGPRGWVCDSEVRTQDSSCWTEWKMIRMSLDKETVLPHEVSPAFPATISLSEQPQLAKTRPLRPKNGLQLPGNSQTALASAPPTQRIAKRRYSMGVGFKGLAKRRRRAISDSQSEPVLPSHFLLGGNIFDPLNLNSLLDEDVNRATNQETPKCSPLPSRGGDPVEILVPRDITDPLNLKGGGRDGKGGGGSPVVPPEVPEETPDQTPWRRRRSSREGGATCSTVSLHSWTDSSSVDRREQRLSVSSPLRTQHRHHLSGRRSPAPNPPQETQPPSAGPRPQAR